MSATPMRPVRRGRAQDQSNRPASLPDPPAATTAGTSAVDRNGAETEAVRLVRARLLQSDGTQD